jgi:hypothetical protein
MDFLGNSTDCLFLLKELKTGFLALLVCMALYGQIDARIWNGLRQLLARLMIRCN